MNSRKINILVVAIVALLISVPGSVLAAVSGSQPGINLATMPQVTPQESENAILSRQPVSGLIQSGSSTKMMSASMASSAPTGPASITELARALRNNPDLIYEYVRNNIEYYPVWGIQKGPVGTILDNYGTAFDQASLMVSLLRQAGYTASYVKGQINLNADQVRDWLGIDTSNACAVGQLLSSGQVPIASITAATSFTCPGSPVALMSMKISHVWVKANINGINYVFDPSFKPHTIKTGINLEIASGYNAASYLTAAKTGATVTSDYVQGINRTNIRNSLNTYGSNLVNFLRSNQPAGELIDVLGGKEIIPYTGASVRQAVLPYQDTSVATTEWTADIPANYRPTIRIRHQGIDKTFTSDAIYGKRLSITYNASKQPVLMLDGVSQATGTATTLGAALNVTFDVIHTAYTSTNSNQSFFQTITAGGTYVISNGWGPMGRGSVELHRTRLSEAKAAGTADSSELVLGSSLAVLSATWITQMQQTGFINDRLANTNTVYQHLVGIAGYHTSAYVDLPGLMVSLVSQTNDTNKTSAAFFNLATHASILESTAAEQVTGVSAVSTVKLIDIASSNNNRIYDAKSAAQYTAAVKPNLLASNTCSTNQMNIFQTAVNGGHRLILPSSCNISENVVSNDWSGVGYFDILVQNNSSSIGAIIGGGYLGGFSTYPQPVAQTISNTSSKSVFADMFNQFTGSSFGDPIDMTKGHFLYSRDDIKAGVGEFPMSLNFKKLYSSGLRTQKGLLGNGWTHNLSASATDASDGLQALGEDSALDASGSIVEMMVSFDLMSDAAKPLDKMVIATLGQRWFGDQLISNAVTVQQGLNGEVFVKLPDGTYNAPPGNSAKLIKNVNNTYTYEMLNRAKLDFNTVGKIATYSLPNGVQAVFTYTSGYLTKVANSLGRSLTLTNSSGRVTKVADGARNVTYGYDTSGNLTSFTDATAKKTTMQYDLPGRLTKLYYPSKPTVAFITNVYDSLGRVQTQTNANGQLYSYYFAGSRSEEVSPGNVSRVSYVDAQGKVLKEIDPLGRQTLNNYDGQSRMVSKIMPEGNSVNYIYDDAPCAAQKRCTHNVKTVNVVPKLGSGLPTLTTSMTYESNFNRIARSIDPKGQTTLYTYTAQGNPLKVTRPFVYSPSDGTNISPTISFGYIAYTPTGFPTFYLMNSETNNISNNSFVTNTTTYNTANKYVPSQVIVDSGVSGLTLRTTYTYDAFGNITKEDGPRTDVTDITNYIYDAERRVTTITNALSKATKLVYDADGRVVTSAAQIGTKWLVSCKTYTNTGKVLSAWGPGETTSATTCPVAASPVAVTAYVYDSLDRLQRVTENLTPAEGGNRVSETTYNAANSVVSVKRAVGNSLAQTYATYTYTPNGLTGSVKDAKNNLTTYEYDGHDRKIKVRYPDKTISNSSSISDYEGYGYDNNSNVISQRLRNGQTVTFGYDNINRLLSRTYPTGLENVTLKYDLMGRIVHKSSPGNTLSAVYYSWDRIGRLKSMFTSDINSLDMGSDLSATGYEYDAAGNLTRITYPGYRGAPLNSFNVTTTYDALNRPTAIKELGTTTLATYAYDDLSRRTTVTRGNGSTITSYAYNTQSGLSSLSHNLTGTAQDNTWSYTRNQVQEIANNNWTNDSYQWSGYSNGTRNYTPNGLNQYSTAAGAALTYDANGNLTGDGVWTYSYNLDNRLTSANKSGLTSTLRYDTDGRLTSTNFSGVNTYFAYAGTSLMAEYDSLGNMQRRYVYGPGVDEPIVVYEGSTTTNKQWLYADHQGSIVATANSAGTSTATYTYGPYGEPNVTTGSRFRYTGQQLLGPLNLYYYKARFYSPALGRFLQTDPVGYADDMNMYAYVGNNPINYTDPTGETAAEATSLAVGFTPAGTVADVYTLITGKDLFTGESVPFVWAVAGIIPGVSEMRKAGNAVEGVANVAKEIPISRAKYGEAADHIADAQKAGHPDVLEIARDGASANRNASIGGLPKVTGKQLDEYPPAMFKEGGAGASVRAISPKDNMAAGACIGNACRGLANGEKVRIKVVP